MPLCRARAPPPLSLSGSVSPRRDVPVGDAKRVAGLPSTAAAFRQEHCRRGSPQFRSPRGSDNGCGRPSGHGHGEPVPAGVSSEALNMIRGYERRRTDFTSTAGDEVKSVAGLSSAAAAAQLGRRRRASPASPCGVASPSSKGSGGFVQSTAEEGWTQRRRRLCHARPLTPPPAPFDRACDPPPPPARTGLRLFPSPARSLGCGSVSTPLGKGPPSPVRPGKRVLRFPKQREKAERFGRRPQRGGGDGAGEEALSVFDTCRGPGARHESWREWRSVSGHRRRTCLNTTTGRTGEASTPCRRRVVTQRAHVPRTTEDREWFEWTPWAPAVPSPRGRRQGAAGCCSKQAHGSARWCCSGEGSVQRRKVSRRAGHGAERTWCNPKLQLVSRKAGYGTGSPRARCNLELACMSPTRGSRGHLG
eukprot:Hpha_TRINITY_DN14775_c0_g2::TRINITY_DN14775_c0_g2_i1::g.102752::m.102752